MAESCVICDEPTTSTVRGSTGTKEGPMCEDCQFWCDGNIIVAS